MFYALYVDLSLGSRICVQRVGYMSMMFGDVGGDDMGKKSAIGGGWCDGDD